MMVLENLDTTNFSLTDFKSTDFRLKVWSYDLQAVELACEKIKTVPIGVMTGPIRLPKEKRRWCLLKSPHVNKKSREHFETTIYGRSIQVLVRPNEIEQFGLKLCTVGIPPGVRIEVINSYKSC
jgi:small subunit ribosomal protein S10